MPDLLERRTALCRGCEAQLLEMENGLWVDPEGRAACIPAPYAGRLTVPHIPLPEGFRGAPS